MSPLMWAASEGHADVVKVLIAAGFCDFLLLSVCICVNHIGVDPLRVPGSGPSQNFSREGFLQLEPS